MSSKKRIRRRPGKFINISSNDLASQGPGTWIQVKRVLSMGALQPIMALVNYRKEIKFDDETGAVDALDGLLDELRSTLPPAIRDWNWLTDCEAELASPVENMAGTPDCIVRLETPIWADSELDDPMSDASPTLPGDLAYLGQFPENYDAYRIASVSDNGRKLVLHGQAKREYVSGEDFVLIGLPKPRDASAFATLGVDELIWIVNVLTDKLTAQSAGMKDKKKAAASNGG